MIREGFCQYFNVRSNWDPTPEMPAAEKARIEVADSGANLEGILNDIVVQCYDIRRDHRHLMDILNHPQEQKGQRFVQLRRTYPVRREFYNTEVVLPADLSHVRDIISTWGFRVV